MSFNLNDQQLAIINAWEKQFPGKFTDDVGNVNLLLGFIQNHSKVLSIESLNTAARACHAALKFVPGHEPPDPRADQKAQAEADRKRKLRLQAGFNVDQSKIHTELDDNDDDKGASRAEILATAQRDLDMQQCLDDMNHLIEHHIKTRGSRVDYAATGRERDQLRQELKRLIDNKVKPEIIRERLLALQHNFDNRSAR